MAKRLLSSALSSILVILAPGVGCYDALAQRARSTAAETSQAYRVPGVREGSLDFRANGSDYDLTLQTESLGGDVRLDLFRGDQNPEAQAYRAVDQAAPARQISTPEQRPDDHQDVGFFGVGQAGPIAVPYDRSRQQAPIADRRTKGVVSAAAKQNPSQNTSILGRVVRFVGTLVAGKAKVDDLYIGKQASSSGYEIAAVEGVAVKQVSDQGIALSNGVPNQADQTQRGDPPAVSRALAAPEAPSSKFSWLPRFSIPGRLVTAAGVAMGVAATLFYGGDARADQDQPVQQAVEKVAEQVTGQPGILSQPLFWVGLVSVGAVGLLLLARRRISALILRTRQAVARAEEARERALPAGQAPGLPLSFWIFFAGAVLNQFGSWMGAVLIPLYAATQISPEFALVVQATYYAFLMVGSNIGAKKYNSRTLFVAYGVGYALSILAAATVGSLGLTPMAFMIGFILARVVGGVFSGMTMGIGENTIMTEMLGQDKARLERANGLYSIANYGMGVLAPGVVAFLVPVLGPAALILIAVAALALSLIPLLLVHLKPQTAAAPGAPAGQAPEKARGEPLPKAIKFAFSFANLKRMSFYGLIGPIFGVVVFQSVLVWGGDIASLLVLANSLGHLIAALMLGMSDKNKEWFRRRVPVLGRLPYLSERHWLALTMASWTLFTAACFLAPSAPLLALAADVLLGVAVRGALVKLQARIQSQVDPAVQPKTFKQLFYATMISILLVFAVLKLAPAVAPLFEASVSLFWLLAGMSVVLALVGAVIAALVYRLPSTDSK